MAHVVNVPNVVTMMSADNFSKELADILRDHDDIELQLSQLTDIDLSFVQIVYAAREQAGRDGKSLRLSRPAGSVVTALLDRAGFLTTPTSADLDFWFHGELPQ